MEFTGFAAEMAALAGGYGSVDPAAADRDALDWALGVSRRMRGMLDARDAQITGHLEALIRLGIPGNQPGADEPAGGAEAAEAAGSVAAGGSQGSAAVGGTGGGSGGHRETAEEYALRLRRAKWLRRLGLFEAALEAGAITTAHVDALAAVLDHVEPTVVFDVLADEDAVLEMAHTVTKASFARYLRSRVDRVRADGGAGRLQSQINDSFGSLNQDEDLDLYRLFAQLDPIRGEAVFTAVRQRVDQLQQSGAAEGMRRGQVIAQAVTDLICGAVDLGAGGVNVLVIADLLTLLHGPHDGSICETGDGAAIPVDVVRDLCRQAATTITVAVRDQNGVTVAVGERLPPDDDQPHAPRSGADGPQPRPDDRGVPPPAEPAGGGRRTGDIAAMIAEALATASDDRLHMGRNIRLANREQRRALRAMYRHCAHPGCRVPFADCFIHHVTPWEHDGPTDPHNLLPLCGRHHHQIHEGGWRLTIDIARTLRWHQPGGRLDTEHPFQPIGATSGRAGASQPKPAAEDGIDGPNTSTDAKDERSAADPATGSRWTRSRSARGAPPASDDEPVRLFDPPAA